MSDLALGSRSNMDENDTFKASQMSNSRAALTRFVPISYFWICWNAMPSALPSSVWDILMACRRSRIRAPMYASMAVALLGVSFFGFAFFMH